MTKINFDEAVEMLDDYIQTKTVHGVNGIKEKMSAICQLEFAGMEDQNDFANICSNFEKYCLITKTTSFGRKQFEALFEQGFEIQDSMEVALKMMEPQEDPLPDVMTDDEEFPTFETLEKAHGYIRYVLRELWAQEAKVKAYEERFEKMRELMNPWD